jgi:hypothetical protein
MEENIRNLMYNGGRGGERSDLHKRVKSVKSVSHGLLQSAS